MRTHLDEALLAIDLGTTFCKASLYSLAGELLDEARVPLQTPVPAPGWSEQDSHAWVTACVTAIRALIARNHVPIRSIGLSGRMGTIVYLDQHVRPISPATLYADTRGAPYRRQLLDAHLAETLGLGLINTLPRMMWMREHRPDVVRSASRVCGAKEFLGLWLTGEYATDYSNGPPGSDWPVAVAELAGVASAALPPVMPPTSVLGSVRQSAATETGLEVGTPVVVGASDGACASLGVGACRSGTACISLSTTGAVRLVRYTPPSVRALVDRGGFGYRLEKDLWLWGGAITTAGAALGWFEGMFEGLEMTAERLAQEAASAPVGSAGVRFQPYLQGMYGPEYRPGERGALTGLSVAHGRSHVARAIMEGVAYSIRAVADALEVRSTAVETWFLTGGSARSELWRQIVADVLGVALCWRDGGTSLGAAILSACGSSLYPTVQASMDAMLRPGHVVELSSASADYAALYSAFRRAVDLGGGIADGAHQ